MPLYTSPKLGVDSEVFTDLTLKVRPEIWQRAYDHVSSHTQETKAAASSACHYLFLVACLTISQSCTRPRAPSASEQSRVGEWSSVTQQAELNNINNNNNFILCCTKCFALYCHHKTNKIKQQNQSIRGAQSMHPMYQSPCSIPAFAAWEIG